MHSDGVIGSSGEVAVGVSKATDIPDAKAKIDAFIETIRADGTLADMDRRWQVERNYQMPAIAAAKDPDFTIRFGTTGPMEPFTFYANGELVGFDIELMQRFALWCNAALVTDTYDWAGIIYSCGAGKSDYIASHIYVSGGNIFVFGRETGERGADLCALRERMGMVFQSFNLFSHLNAIKNVMPAPVLLKGASRQQAYEEGMRLLKSVGMAECARQHPEQLSGGQKQRVAIARTLAMKPEIVLFDEPTRARDPGMVGEVLTVLHRLAKGGLTMLIATNELRFARDVSTRVFYMDEGRDL